MVINVNKFYQENYIYKSLCRGDDEINNHVIEQFFN
jgi:hypothetical protein